MSYCTADTLIDCEITQRHLNELWGRDPLLTQEDSAIASLLLSPRNRRPLVQDSLQGADGKDKTVRLIWQKEQCLLDADDTALSCTATDEINDCDELIVVSTSTFQNNFKYDKSLLSTVCVENTQWMQRQVNANLRTIARSVERFLVQQMILFTGKFSTITQGAVTPSREFKTVQTLDCTGGAGCVAGMDRTLLRHLKQDARRNNFVNAPTIIGFGLISDYMDDIETGCCNDDGADFQRILTKFGAQFVESQFADAWTVSDCTAPFISYDMSALQLIQFPDWKGGQGTMSGSVVNRTIQVPLSSGGSIEVDHAIIESCDEAKAVINHIFRWNGGLLGLPDNMFCETGQYEGNNGVLQYCVSNPA